MAAGQIDPKIHELMSSFDPASDGIPEWATNEQLWAQAEQAVDPSGAGATMQQPWLVVALTYKALGGTIDEQAAQQAAAVPVGASPGAPAHHVAPAHTPGAAAAPVSGA